MINLLNDLHGYIQQIKMTPSWAFFQGGQKYSGGGGQKPNFCLKNNKKDTIFLQKVYKHTIFGRQEGARAPSPPSGRQWTP
jgi:hypothetical protein